MRLDGFDGAVEDVIDGDGRVDATIEVRHLDEGIAGENEQRRLANHDAARSSIKRTMNLNRDLQVKTSQRQ